MESNPPLSAEEMKDLLRDCACGQKLASNPKTPLHLLRKLAESEPATVASNPACSTEFLIELSKLKLDPQEDYFIWAAIARHPNISGELIEKILKDVRWELRAALALNENISPKVLHELAGDPKPAVRRKAALNANLSNDTLTKLSVDHDVIVRTNLASHKHLTREIFNRLIQDVSASVRQKVASHGNLDLRMLARLSRDSDFQVRSISASHKNISVKLLRTLGSDPSFAVRSSVIANPKVPVVDVIRLYARADDQFEQMFNAFMQRLLLFMRTSDGKRLSRTKKISFADVQACLYKTEKLTESGAYRLRPSRLAFLRKFRSFAIPFAAKALRSKNAEAFKRSSE